MAHGDSYSNTNLRRKEVRNEGHLLGEYPLLKKETSTKVNEVSPLSCKFELSFGSPPTRY